MSTLFGNLYVVAVYAPEELPGRKIKTMLKGAERCDIIHFDDLDKFKNYIEHENVNIAICDIDKPDGSSSNRDMQTLVREILGYKRGTYLIALTSDPRIGKLTTLFRLGVHSMLFKEEGHKAYKDELSRAIDHLDYWKGRFEQLLVDRSMAKEFDSLFDDLE